MAMVTDKQKPDQVKQLQALINICEKLNESEEKDENKIRVVDEDY